EIMAMFEPGEVGDQFMLPARPSDIIDMTRGSVIDEIWCSWCMWVNSCEPFVG
ncbi:unnamed protein product, partial [Candidula unifasciata]